MRPIILTLAALIVLNLVTPACTPAQSTTKKGSEETIAGAQRDAEADTKEAQAATGEAQLQAREVLKQTDAVQKAADNAAAKQDSLAYALAVQSSASPARSFGLLQYTPQSILVIPIDEIKIEDIATITEDVGIMCRVLDKKLEQERLIVTPSTFAYGFPFGGATGTEGIYLEGYGALFVLNVNFPLIPPPETKKEEQPKEEGDAFWEETKNELHSSKEGEGFGSGYADDAVIYSYGVDRSGEKYDAEKVEQLKTTLVKSLKHAANIHCLKPDESVVISVRGCAPAVVVQETTVEEIGGSNSARTSSSRSVSTSRRVPHQKVLSVKKDSATPAVLTIRAKKSDIDAFSKGEIGVDQFRQKVRIHTYQTSGRNMVSELTESNQRF